MKTVGEFTSNDEEMAMTGQIIALSILTKVNSGEISINEDIFKEFLSCIFAEGNFEFLKVVADHTYKDSRKEIVLEFIRMVETMTSEGHDSLVNKVG